MQARDLHLRLVDAGENVDAPIVIGEAGLRRPHAPRRAVEQPDAEHVLELHHRLARRRSGRPSARAASAKLPSATTLAKAFIAPSLSIDCFPMKTVWAKQHIVSCARRANLQQSG